VRKGSFFSTKIYREHINMFLSKLGYSELVQRLFEKMTFSLVDPLLVGCHGNVPSKNCAGATHASTWRCKQLSLEDHCALRLNVVIAMMPPQCREHNIVPNIV